ncbi:UNVERIFIED_CONTAM: hypothetical protein DES50_102315 [Williamsia faeni]
MNTKERYPQLIPLLIDWVKNLEIKTRMTDQRDLVLFR